MKRCLVGLIAAVVLEATPRAADACGLTPPLGPSGLPTVCRGDVPRVHASIAVGGTSTRIDFPRSSARLLQGASVVSADVNPFVGTALEPLTLSLSGGVSLGGWLERDGERSRVNPGWIGGVGAAYRFGGRGAWPFVQPTASLSLAQATVENALGRSSSFRALDWRFGLAVGKTIGSIAAPFVVARYFGGGTEFAPAGGHGVDHYRYHVGIGSAFALSRRVDAVAELAFLGERRATLGFGYSF